jgi:hypothetical protein
MTKQKQTFLKTQIAVANCSKVFMPSQNQPLIFCFH